MKRPWRKLKSRIIHKNPYYFISVHDVIRPDGRLGKYYVINAHKSVIIIAENKNEEIFLVGQTRYPIGSIYSWELPGGSIEKGSTKLLASLVLINNSYFITYIIIVIVNKNKVIVSRQNTILLLLQHFYLGMLESSTFFLIT